MEKKRKKTRHNGEGSLERKPNGVYIVRWSKDGKRFSRSTGETDPKKAEKKRQQIMKEQMPLCHTYKEVKIRKDIYDRIVELAGGKSINTYLEKVVLAGESGTAEVR